MCTRAIAWTLASLLVLAACVKRGGDVPLSASTASPKPPASHCSATGRLFDGGTVLIMQDGASVWYKVSGNDGGLPLYVFRGGPGDSSYSFEKSVGALLERYFRVVYIDLRGGGRSAVEANSPYGMAYAVGDIERIRAALGHARIGLVGHSFGGAVAAEYVHRYPERVVGVVFADTATDLHAALRQQVALVGANAATLFPDEAQAVTTLAMDEAQHPLDRLMGLSSMVSRPRLQRALHFATQEGQDKLEALDALSGLTDCARPGVLAAYRAEGYLDRELPTVAFRIPTRSALFVGRYSHVIGEEGYRRAVSVWGSTPIMFDKSGHHPYLEEPETFVAQTRALFEGLR